LDQFQALASVVGVRQIVGRSPEEDAKNGTNALIADPEFKAGLQSLASRGLSFDLQLIPELMEPMGKVLAQVPDLQVALCHAGSPYDRSSDGNRNMARGPCAICPPCRMYRANYRVWACLIMIGMQKPFAQSRMSSWTNSVQIVLCLDQTSRLFAVQ
jgi:hypothetical protein